MKKTTLGEAGSFMVGVMKVAVLFWSVTLVVLVTGAIFMYPLFLLWKQLP